MCDAIGPSCSERDGARTDTGTIGDADGLKRAEGKVDISILNKINMTPILVRY